LIRSKLSRQSSSLATSLSRAFSTRLFSRPNVLTERWRVSRAASEKIDYGRCFSAVLCSTSCRRRRIGSRSTALPITKHPGDRFHDFAEAGDDNGVGFGEVAKGFCEVADLSGVDDGHREERLKPSRLPPGTDLVQDTRGPRFTPTCGGARRGAEAPVWSPCSIPTQNQRSQGSESPPGASSPPLPVATIPACM
jgi:hypothetical protein